MTRPRLAVKLASSSALWVRSVFSSSAGSGCGQLQVIAISIYSYVRAVPVNIPDKFGGADIHTLQGCGWGSG
jgi:hypothetical protein